MADTWLQTVKRHAFHYHDTSNRKSTIDIRDISRSLARQVRFCGHTSRLLSVAEHSIAVMRIAKHLNPSQGPLFYLHALLHDAHEAYTGDLPGPFKTYLFNCHGCNIDRIQRELQRRILKALEIEEIPVDQQQRIAYCDLLALKTERELFMPSRMEWTVDKVLEDISPFKPFYFPSPSPTTAHAYFTRHYKQLTADVKEQLCK